MTSSENKEQLHKHIVRDRFLAAFAQPFRFRVELEKIKQKLKGKGHE